MCTARGSCRSASLPLSGRLAVCSLVALLLAAAQSRADDEGPMGAINGYVVYSPKVVKGQTEVEVRAAQYRDKSIVIDGGRGYLFSIAHSFTNWWRPEVYLGQYQRAPREPTRLMAYEFENIFQLAPAGKYWADPGFLVSYEFATHTGTGNELEFGPLLEKRSGRITQRLNLIWEHELGRFAESDGYTFRGAYSVNYAWRREFAPRLEFYARPRTSSYQLGPVVYGEHHVGTSELEYSAGVVFGLSHNASQATLLLRLEYEIF